RRDRPTALPPWPLPHRRRVGRRRGGAHVWPGGRALLVVPEDDVVLNGLAVGEGDRAGAGRIAARHQRVIAVGHIGELEVPALVRGGGGDHIAVTVEQGHARLRNRLVVAPGPRRAVDLR